MLATSVGCGSGDDASPSPERADAGPSQSADATATQPSADGSVPEASVLPEASLPADAAPQDGSIVTTTSCAQCLADLCDPERAGCTADPDCSTFLLCLDACPVDSTGAAAATCQQACPTGATTSGATAEQELLGCLSAGSGSLCPACGGDAGSPILDQSCPTPTVFVNQCDRCAQANCCVANANCHNNLDCGSFLDCFLGCITPAAVDAGALDGGDVGEAGSGDGAISDGDASDGATLNAVGTCEEACAQQFPSGRADWAAYGACTSVYCGGPDDCNGPTSPCLECSTTQCADEYVSYAGSSDGFALNACISGCDPSDFNCQVVCYMQFPDELGNATSVNQCALEQCPACQSP